MKKPFVLFSGQTYYPAPGWMGYRGDFKKLNDAIEAGEQGHDGENDWWQVVDLNQKTIVAGAGTGYTGLFGEVPANP